MEYCNFVKKDEKNALAFILNASYTRSFASLDFMTFISPSPLERRNKIGSVLARCSFLVKLHQNRFSSLC